MLKYLYLYDKYNNLISANKGKDDVKYKMYKDDKDLSFIWIDSYTKKDGTYVSCHFKCQTTATGESPDHYNAKMKIVDELGYFDTIFNQFVSFDKVIPERKTENNKIPDLQCYQNNQLVCYIEIYHTNPKTDDDIKIFKKENIPLIEIDIKNGNKTKHLILPKILESNRQKYSELNNKIKGLKKGQLKNIGIHNRIKYFKREIRNIEREIRFIK